MASDISKTGNTAPAGMHLDRRRFIGSAGAAVGGLALTSTLGATAAQAATPPAAVTGHHPPRDPGRSARRKATAFGIGYECWFYPGGNQAGEIIWDSTEAKPVLGYYSSMDTHVIKQHAEWISKAGMDFILIDWSNGVFDNITQATLKLLDVYSTLRTHPKVAFLIGLDNGQPSAKAISLLETEVLDKPDRARHLQLFHGKPLLSVYGVSPVAAPPTFENPRFTTRYMNAFHEIVMNPWGNWSWEDRNPIANGPMKFLPQFSAGNFNGWTAAGNWSLGDAGYLGTYATSEPAGGTATGSLTSPAFTVTERAFTFMASGADSQPKASGNYRTIAEFGQRNLFVLTDARSGEVLRHAEPPGWTPVGFLPPSLQNSTGPVWYLRQWDLTGLEGRSVRFQAVNNSPGGPNFGWMAVGGVAQTSPEQMTAMVSTPGNAVYGAWTDWDAHARNSGASLVAAMQGVYDFEPEVALVQQWNEFGSPDQFSVSLSNDIEPTVINNLAGADSDGWGFYYLDLVSKLIRQYREGAAFPAVALDTRYP